MAFKIEIEHNGKTLSFVPRTVGQTGRDILAVKMALGLIKKIENGRVISEVLNERAEISPEVPLDRQNWFDCQTGLGTGIKQACLFNLQLQSAIVSFQTTNRFLITNYLFEKYSTRKIIEKISNRQDITATEWHAIASLQIDAAHTMYDNEFGILGEATLAVLHGWRPQTIISNSGFVHDRSMFNSTNKIVDVVPSSIWALTNSNTRRSLGDQGIILRSSPDPDSALAVSSNNERDLETFLDTAPSHRLWVSGLPGFLRNDTAGTFFPYRGVNYRSVWENTSMLTPATRRIINQTEELEEIDLLGQEELRERINNFFYPDPFSTSDPFIIDDNRIGIFYETEYELSPSGPLPVNELGEIQKIEDSALEHVLEFYNKPKIWNHLIDDDTFISEHGLKNTNLAPDHVGFFPVQVSQERVKSSKVYKALELTEKLNQEQLTRLRESLDTDQTRPAYPRNFNSREEFEEHVQIKINSTSQKLTQVREEMRKALQDGIFSKSDFWILTTQNLIDDMPGNYAQSWRTTEIQSTEPLIKFIEYRTPSLRPGHKYRALLEINRNKLDLIIYGDNPPDSPIETFSQASTAASRAETVKVCENLEPEQAKRRFEEFRVHASKKRRELARVLREKIQENNNFEDMANRPADDPTSANSLQVTTVDMGPIGPINLNKAFSGLYGLSGITDDYEYTQKALRLLVDSGSTILEEIGIFDTSAESLNNILNDANPSLDDMSPDEIEAQTNDEFNQIMMPWEEFTKRIETASEDLSEAASTIEREAIKFKRGSNFKPKNEAQILKRVTNQIIELMDSAKILEGDNMALSAALEKYKEEEVLIQIKFDPTDYEDLGPKNGKRITGIAVLVQETGLFGENQDKPFIESNPVFYKDIDLKKWEALQAFDALIRPRTVNYVSQIGNMTNPFPSTFKGFIKSFWDDKRLSCSQLGIDSEKGIALSLVGSYTTGIAIDLEKDEEGLTEALKDWAKKNFKEPAEKWVEQSGKNMTDSLKNTFDEEEALNAFGKLCTLEDLYKEFIDKVDLKSLLCDYLKCVGLPAFEFKLPNLYLPPFPKIPILGWYGGMWKFLRNRFKEILIRILCTFVRTLIDKLAFPFCEEQLEEFIAAGSSATPIMNKALAEALTNTGITSGNKEKAKDFFEDVSKLTTGSEICHLLKGRPLDAAGMQMLQRMVEKSGLSEDLDSDEAIANYFGVLGTYIPFEICEELENLSSSDSTLGTADPEDCSELANSLRALRNRLQTGDSNLSDEEVQNVLDLAQDNLDNQKAAIAALSGANLEFALPDSFSANSNNLINTSLPPAMTMAIKQISEDMFEPARSLYTSCLSNYVSSMKIQAPSTPIAGEDGYDQVSTLTLEASLEQLRRYAASIPSTESGTLEGALRRSGLFARAKYNGLGDWAVLSQPNAGRQREFDFLNPHRDLENQNIRIENQQMIEELIKQDISRTLKIKQIISAFTVFENFGHYPAGAWAHWAQKMYRPISKKMSEDNVNYSDWLDDDALGWTFSNWWRVRPTGTGLDSTIDNATEWLDWENHQTNHPRLKNRQTKVPEMVHNAMARNWNVTVSLQETRWYRGWIGALNQDDLNEIYFPHPNDPIEEIAKRTDLLSSWFAKVDSIEWNSWLELIVPSHDLSPTFNGERRDLYNSNVAFPRAPQGAVIQGNYAEPYFGGYKISAQDYSNSSLRSNQLLQGAVDFFYGDEDYPPEWQNRAATREFIGDNSAQSRDFIFEHVIGSPLFLVGGNDGKEFLPDEHFGTRIMTDLDEFASEEPHGKDIFLPLAKEGDFQTTFPDLFLGELNLPADAAFRTYAKNRREGRIAGGEHFTFPIGDYYDSSRNAFMLNRKIVPMNSRLAIRSSMRKLNLEHPEAADIREIPPSAGGPFVHMVLGHPFQEVRVWAPGQIRDALIWEGSMTVAVVGERGRHGVGQELQPGFQWVGNHHEDCISSYLSLDGDSSGTWRQYQYNLVVDAANIEDSRATFTSGQLFFPKSHFQLSPSKWWTSTTFAGEAWGWSIDSSEGPHHHAEHELGINHDNIISKVKDRHSLYLQGDRAVAGMSDWYFMNHKEQFVPVAPYNTRPTPTVRQGIGSPGVGDHAGWEGLEWIDNIRKQERRRDEHYKRASQQLYMKIVQEASSYSIPSNHLARAVPFHDKYSLTRFLMGALKSRIEILENAMIFYGTKNQGNFRSVFDRIDLPAPFGGFGSAAVSIMPQNVAELFTLFETERVYKPGAPMDNNPDNFHLVHRRFYRDHLNQEVEMPYRKFIRIMRDPLLKSADKREFYLKPADLNESVVPSLAHGRAKMHYRTNTDGRAEISENILQFILGRVHTERRILSEDTFFLDREELQNLQMTAAEDSENIAQKLLLDNDRDRVIEIDLQGIDLGSEEGAMTAFNNNPALLEIAGERMNKLSTIATQLVSTIKQGFTAMLLPNMSSLFELISVAHPSVGSNLNAVYNQILKNEEVYAKKIGFKLGTGPYSPGVNLVDYPTSRGQEDRFNIVIDGDANLAQGPNHTLKTNPFNRNPDNFNPDTLDDKDTNSRKIMRFCNILPSQLRQDPVEDPDFKRFNKRDAFDRIVRGQVRQLTDTGLSWGQETLRGEIYDEITENITSELSNSLSNSPIFDQKYADDLESRVSGKAVITSGRCISNRYSLEEASILSFKEAILGDAYQEVIMEMKAPEGSPFSRSNEKLEPFEKAMTSVAVKSFIRICLVELMLKGGMAYSVWDLESVIGDPVFLGYALAHVETELNRNKSMEQVWKKTLERNTGINNYHKALESVVREEATKLPQYSQQIFHPNKSGMDFYNWFVYGKTLLRDQEEPIEVSENRNFYQKEGLFYEFPVPHRGGHSGNGRNWFGATHDHRRRQIFGEALLGPTREFPKNSQEIRRLTSDEKKSHYEGDSYKPTARLIFENYVRVSGDLLFFFTLSARPPVFEDNVDVNEGPGWVFNFDEFNYAIQRLRDRSEDEVVRTIQNSTVKIGKRLTLLLDGGKPNDREHRNSRIPELIEEIASRDDLYDAAWRERAFKLKVHDDGLDSFSRDADHDGFYNDNKVATIPLTSYETLIDPGDCASVEGIFETGFRPKQDVKHNEFLLKISQDFSKEQEFKNYLEHMFPVRRLMAMSSIFSTSVLGGYNDLPTLMKSVKSMIAFVALATSTPGAQREGLLNLNQSDFAKTVREQYPGDPDDPKCLDFPGLGKEFWEMFWEEIKKLVKYFPSILFRGVANTLDPAYKEMRAHYLNCDIRDLTWDGMNFTSEGRFKLVNGLRQGRATDLQPDGRYVNILTALPLDLLGSFPHLFFGRTKPLESTILKTITYIYSGMVPFLDLTRTFKIPCLDIDEAWKEDEIYDFGKYGRYGHPVSPFTALALTTLQLPADMDKRKSNCETVEVVLDTCDD